jgi:glutaredoxin
MVEGLRTKDIPGSSDHEGIIVYGLLDCEPCREAEAMLEAHDVPHQHVIIEWQKPEIRQTLKKQFFQEYGAQTIYPVLEYQGNRYYGYDEQRWMEILNLEKSGG